MEKYVAIVLVVGVIFTITTTFIAISSPFKNYDACMTDIVELEYRNKVTGKVVIYSGSSGCPPKPLGFFWEVKKINQ